PSSCAPHSVLPAALSCSSGFHSCVRLLSISSICALPRLPRLLPSLVASSKPPAPPPTIRSCSSAGLRAVGRRLFTALLRAFFRFRPAGCDEYAMVSTAGCTAHRRPHQVRTSTQQLGARSATSASRARTAAPKPYRRD